MLDFILEYKMFESKKSIDLSFSTDVLDTNVVRDKIINFIKKDYCIGNYIREGNYWELWMLRYIQENYIENTNILDLGGNIGTTTLLMSEVLSRDCKIYTFEPIYSDILYKNVLENNLLDKVEIYPYAVGNKEATIKNMRIDFNASMNFGGVNVYNVSEENETETMEIKVIPIDYFGFENVSLIKIDVENMEIEVLEGSYELIKKCKPTILIESYKFDELKETNVFKKLIDLGYKTNVIPEGHCDFIMKI